MKFKLIKEDDCGDKLTVCEANNKDELIDNACDNVSGNTKKEMFEGLSKRGYYIGGYGSYQYSIVEIE